MIVFNNSLAKFLKTQQLPFESWNRPALAHQHLWFPKGLGVLEGYYMVLFRIIWPRTLSSGKIL